MDETSEGDKESDENVEETAADDDDQVMMN